MSKRYKMVDGSQSAHCCFDTTIVDTEKPVMMGGVQYVPEYGNKAGVPQWESVCECFEEADAKLICDALNLQDAMQKDKAKSLNVGRSK